MKKALLIIDVQKDYFPGGNCELWKAEETLEVIGKVLDVFREREFPVFYIQHIASPGAGFFAPGTEGVEIHPQISPRSAETVIVKHYPDSFYKTELQKKLAEHQVEELAVCGMMTHMCVDTTVRAAMEYGYKVTLVADGCTTKDLTWDGRTIAAEVVQKTFLASLNGRFADIVTSKVFDCEKNI